MKKKILLVLLISLMMPLVSLRATTFRLVPLDKLVEEASSAAEVKLKEKKSYMNKMGMIMTDYVFQILESYNLENSDLEGEYLKITLIGGSVNGVTSYIESAPEFEIGEKSFLLLKRIESRIYLSNFTMGKFKIEESEGKIFYISSVFPKDPDIGRVGKERMIEMVKSKFKLVNENTTNTQFYNNTNKILTHEKNIFKKRAPAQDGFQDVPQDKRDFYVLSIALFFLFLGGAGLFWWKMQQGKSE